MYKNKTVSLIVPVLNEEKGLRDLFKHIPSLIDEVMIVDGGSKDKTVELAKKHGAKVVIQKSKGYGAAYLEGFKATRADIIATVDGDGTYPVDAIPRMIEWLIDKKLDFISGSRFPLSNINSMAQLNFLGNLVVTTITSWLFNTKIIDINSGMWVFKRPFLKKAKFISSAWNFSLDIKIEAMMLKDCQFLEYPINYYERLGETKVVRPWKTGLKSLFFLIAKRNQVRKRARQGKL